MNIKRLLILIGTVLLGFTLVSMWMLFLSAPPESARAASYTVCLSGPPTCDFSSVQAAVDAANEGDEIKVAEGNYTGVHGRSAPPGYEGPSIISQVVYITKTVTIRGGYTTTNNFAGPPDPLSYPSTVDAQNGGRGLFIAGEISPTIEGLGITGGNAAGLGGGKYGCCSYNDTGGSIYIVNASATIRRNQVFNNSGFCGSGLFLVDSHSTLDENIIDSNISPYDFMLGRGPGGGLYLCSSDSSIKENVISSNIAGDGGGLHLSGGSATIDGNTIISNTGSVGGGLYLQSVATLTANTIISNNATDVGGGLYSTWSSPSIIDNIISNNNAQHGGGGVFFHNAIAGAWLNRNTITVNVADEGGGIYISGGNAIMINNIMADNQANQGSGLLIQNSSADLIHNTIARSSGDVSSGIYVVGSCAGCNVTLTNTILVNHTVGIHVEQDTTATLDATLWGSGAWANITDWAGDGTINTTANYWGNPDFVDYEAGDYHIGPGSVAIDEGTLTDVTRDIDNQPRQFNKPDIGADEYWPPGTPIYTHLPLVSK